MMGKAESSQGPVPAVTKPSPTSPTTAVARGAVGGDVDGDVILDVVEVGMIGVNQANPGLAAGHVVGVQDVFAVEQVAHLLRVLSELCHGVGGQAHRVAARVAGTEREDGASPARAC